MMISRRVFILGTGLVAAVPALTNPLSASATARSDSSLPLPARLRPQPPASATNANGVVFRIEGWDIRSDRADDYVWIAPNRSWRTAWR